MENIVELDIVDLAYNGRAVAYDKGKATFVDGGLPGEKVEAEIVRSKRGYNQARLLRIINKSAQRIEPVCRHYGICGGCTWQDLDYDKQLYYKRNQVIACLKRIGKFDDLEVAPVRPSPAVFFYRNKMEFSYHVCPRDKNQRGFVLGLHERGRFDRIFDVVECHLQSAFSNRLIDFLRWKTSDLNIPAYDFVKHKGFLRFAIVREGKNTGQRMLVLVTADGQFSQKRPLIEALVDNFPELTTVVWTVNDSITNIARGKIREFLHGPGYIEEEILGLRFRISPGSFLQTNSCQTEKLYQTAIEQAELKPTDNLLDLYCGAGSIGLCAASRAGRVIGVDIQEEAIESAKINASMNEVMNCRFFAGPARRVLASPELRAVDFDVVIIDPPRTGMHSKALNRVVEIGATRLVYISCNPATFSRDAALLRENGYTLEEVIPFDMFPHTMHIELVSRFTKCD